VNSDFDPEDVNLYESENEQSGSEDEEGDNARAHYEPVGYVCHYPEIRQPY
jgi:hypothetical protein